MTRVFPYGNAITTNKTMTFSIIVFLYLSWMIWTSLETMAIAMTLLRRERVNESVVDRIRLELSKLLMSSSTNRTRKRRRFRIAESELLDT
jgi:hypothetical protein